MSQAMNGAAHPRQLLLFETKRNKLKINEALALKVFREADEMWENGIGIFGHLKLVQPQHLHIPKPLLERGSKELANFLLFLSLSQRGGLNSDDSIRIMGVVLQAYPELFDIKAAAALHPYEIEQKIRAVAERFYVRIDSDGRQRAGALSFKLQEFSRHWKHNAEVLEKYWGGDIRNIFRADKGFEKYFQTICPASPWKIVREAVVEVDGALLDVTINMRSKNPAGLLGMRKKIFTLLCFWLIEFQLVPEFRIPLVVDFHLMRALVHLGVIHMDWKPLGRGKPKIPVRARPRGLWRYPAVHIDESLVNEIVSWSLEFLTRHQLSPFNVHNALWNLSRVLCARYAGCKSSAIERTDETGRIHALTAKLVRTEDLERSKNWPKNYPDTCRWCPWEKLHSLSGARIPAGPYYDWGTFVNAGPYVVYPARQAELEGFETRELLPDLTRRKNNSPGIVDMRKEKYERRWPMQLRLGRKRR